MKWSRPSRRPEVSRNTQSFPMRDTTHGPPPTPIRNSTSGGSSSTGWQPNDQCARERSERGLQSLPSVQRGRHGAPLNSSHRETRKNQNPRLLKKPAPVQPPCLTKKPLPISPPPNFSKKAARHSTR